MNKLRKRLSKWLLDTAKKLDSNTVNDNCTIPIPSMNEPIIMYDRNHVDRIRAQYQIPNTMFNIYSRMEGYDGFIEERIPEILTMGIAEEIMKVYKEMNLRDFQFWSGAKSNAETLTGEQLDMVESILEDCYSEGIDETTINDIFWFDFDTIREWLGIEDEESEDE